jgi:SET domain-containing protein
MTERIRVKPSDIHGRGVFAVHEVPRGGLLENGELLPLPADEPGASCTIVNYVFELTRTRTCLLLGSVSLCNHSDSPNAEVEIDPTGGTYRLLALRKIRRGEEILIDYGKNYWET